MQIIPCTCGLHSVSIFLLPEYPRPPVNLRLQLENPSLYLSWPVTTPTSPHPDVPPVTTYKVYLNRTLCILTTPTSDLTTNHGRVCIMLSEETIELNEALLPSDMTPPYYLTVKSSNQIHESCHSMEIAIAKDLLYKLIPSLPEQSNDAGEQLNTISSEVSMLSSPTTSGTGMTTTTSDSMTTNSQSQVDEEGVDEGMCMYLYIYSVLVNYVVECC